MSSSDKYERFEAWLKENGAQFDMLELREYDNVGAPDEEEKKEPTAVEESENRGIHSKTHIPPNTTCMTIPRKCLITVEMGQQTPIGHKILHSDLDLDAPKHIFLMIYVLWDRKIFGEHSFFHPYYEILPRTLKNMPIFWTREELAELEGSYLLAQIADRNEAIMEDYESILSIAPELKDIASLQEFKWARMCVCSRNFGLLIDGHRTSALVPHADMLNHYRPRETKWTFEDDKQAFTITTLQAIPAGAQVYDSYGQKCNHRFLLNYGFAVEDNREVDGFCPNEVPLEVELSPDDPIYAKKLDFWSRGESTHDPAKRVRVCVSNNENTRLLFSLLRTLACNEEELLAVSNSMDGAAVSRALFGMGDRNTSTFYRSCRDIRHPLNLRNERAAMECLLSIVDESLSKYPTTLSQDIEALQDEVAYPRFSNRRHAKIQVRGEKEVLYHFRQWARIALDVMDVMVLEFRDAGEMTFEDKIRQLEEKEGGIAGPHHTIVRYCADVLGSLRREELKDLRRKAQTSRQSVY